MPRTTRAAIGPEDRAVSVYIAGNHAEGLVDHLLARLTRRPDRPLHEAWTHSRVGFELADGRRVYFEAIFREGWTGPHPEEKAEAWADKHPHRRIERLWIGDLTTLAVDRIWTRAKAMVEVWPYSPGQLLWIYAAIRMGIRVPKSPRAVVCSEGVARVAGPTVDVSNGKPADQVTPEDNRAAALPLAFLVEHYPPAGTAGQIDRRHVDP